MSIEKEYDLASQSDQNNDEDIQDIACDTDMRATHEAWGSQ